MAFIVAVQMWRVRAAPPGKVELCSDGIDAWSEPGAAAPLDMRLQQTLTGDVFASMHEFDYARLIYEAAGQSVFGIERETTVAAQMHALVRHADRVGPDARLGGSVKPAVSVATMASADDRKHVNRATL